MWDDLAAIGRDQHSGGYRRYAWTATDLTLREWFTQQATSRGMDVDEDRNGNLWAWWLPVGYVGDPVDAFVTGSHLDSVPDGGAFDGPLGVVSAFAAIDILRARGIAITKPIAVTAFSDEEGARFGVACVGSRLSAGTIAPEVALALRDADGVTLADAMASVGRDPHRVGADSTLAQRAGVYVELHVEQGRGLELVDKPIAVASSIWPHGRWEFTLDGAANHAGTTRIVDRHDPMLTFAATAQAARAAATAHAAVATFGKVIVTPNGINAIPSQVLAWLDARASDEPTLQAMVAEINAAAADYGAREGVTVSVSNPSLTPIVEFSAPVRDRVIGALTALGTDIPTLPTAAGHDAGVLAAVLPTAMLFVRNPTGVSHSPAEYAERADCHVGAVALAEVMAEWATASTVPA